MLPGHLRAPQPALSDGTRLQRTGTRQGCFTGAPVDIWGVVGLPGKQCGGDSKTQRAAVWSRAAGRGSFCHGVEGPQPSSRPSCPGRRYLLGLHLLQRVAEHFPLRVTGHLATLARVGSRSQPSSWKGSTRLSRRWCWRDKRRLGAAGAPRRRKAAGLQAGTEPVSACTKQGGRRRPELFSGRLKAALTPPARGSNASLTLLRRKPRHRGRRNGAAAGSAPRPGV